MADDSNTYESIAAVAQIASFTVYSSDWQALLRHMQV